MLVGSTGSSCPFREFGSISVFSGHNSTPHLTPLAAPNLSGSLSPVARSTWGTALVTVTVVALPQPAARKPSSPRTTSAAAAGPRRSRLTGEPSPLAPARAGRTPGERQETAARVALPGVARLHGGTVPRQVSSCLDRQPLASAAAVTCPTRRA